MYDDASYFYAQLNSPQTSDKTSAVRRPSFERKLEPLKASLGDEQLLEKHALQGSNSPELHQRRTIQGPPIATVRRRAQSYTDFHHAVKRYLECSGAFEAPPDSRDVPRRRRRPSLDNAATGSKHARDQIKTDLDFTSMYHDMEDEMISMSIEELNKQERQLQFIKNHFDWLLGDIDVTLGIFDTLSAKCRNVQLQSTAFETKCEGVAQEQRRIRKLAVDIEDNLKYYSYLEPLTKRLNAPGAGNLVRSQDFSRMLTTIDEALDYMGKHTGHKEASTYQSRYRQLMTRGLTLVRTNFISGLREIAQDVSRRIADKQLNDTTMSTLLYAKFRVGAAELKEVAQEIRKRAIRHPDSQSITPQESEYQSLMNELYSSYSATRGKLVIPLTRKKISDVDLAPSTSKDLIAFARTSIGYIRGVCADEQELWREWFADEEGLTDFLESICEPLFDHLRPRIIHETQLMKLCELCTLLQSRYMPDPDEEAEPLDASQLTFSMLISPALEDAQTRLVFRTQTILRDDIQRFKPKKEDIDYPTRNKFVSLSGTRLRRQSSAVKSPTSNSNTEPSTPMPKTPVIVEEGYDSPTGHLDFDTEATFEGWYPTLRNSIWLLSRIYRLVNSTVFDDLAHEIVHTTTTTLVNASHLISALPHRSPHDGRLFLIKHLLILKSQIVAFDIEYVSPDVGLDFSNLTNTFYELRDRGGLFNPRNLWRLLSSSVGGSLLPQVVENMFDAKIELDGLLRTVINEFVSSFANAITSPISTSAMAMPKFDTQAAFSKMQSAVGKEIRILRQKLNEYVDDTRTREILIAAVHEVGVQNYETFLAAHNTSIAPQKNKKAIVNNKKGKARESDVWTVDDFSTWLAQELGLNQTDRMSLESGTEGGPNLDSRRDSYSEDI